MADNIFKETLNLPVTEMPMRAGLLNAEPVILEKWEQEKVYQKLLERNSKGDDYILHDGPPYPNGNIHLGHALNKILKDIVIKFHLMKGDNSPFVPGWDCHGLPIETQLLKELKKNEVKEQEIDVFRDQCREYALKFVEQQKQQFIKMGIFAEFDAPYLTLDPEYEKGVIELFGKMAENDLIYQGKKPIHWCMHCKTALAEAEIEYEDELSPAIFVKFPLKESLKHQQKVQLIVWTTTPWTLPANVAVAVNPNFEYVVFDHKGEKLLCVSDLLPAIKEDLGMGMVIELERLKGKDLVGLHYEHPFIQRTSPIISAGFVSNEDGSGLVHIAPGHGHDDYLAGLEFGLPIIMPVDESGVFTAEAGKYAGKNVFKANEEIIEDLRALGKLLKHEDIKHSYPHCWRCRKPVIFRATEQWFVRMDGNYALRDKALAQIKDVKWYPAWGEKRITAMVQGRPDWCISRQRYWGIPIPVVYCEKCGRANYKGAFNQAIAEAVGKEGTNVWFSKDLSEILPKTLVCEECGNNSFIKDTNIMDVWLESGSSHESVLRQRTKYPADLYLEGSDQHRGWFQSSLLTAVGAYDEAPYKAVLTHGFTIDDKGQKMSKSKGNVIDPLKVVGQHGVDILRLWVSSTDFQDDVILSDKIIEQIKDAFSKIRNTLRFMISNLYDFDPISDSVSELKPLDKWITLKFDDLVNKIYDKYEQFNFHQIYRSIYDFCVIELSAVYLDVQKDNLYCNEANSLTRKSCQTAMFAMAKDMIIMLAPILSYSMEDVYRYLPIEHKPSVFFEPFPVKRISSQPIEEVAKINRIMELRDAINVKLEDARKEKLIGSSLDARLIIQIPDKDISEADLLGVLMVSQVELKQAKELKIEIAKAKGEKCLRCWKYDDLSSEGLCRRCKSVINK